MAWSHTVDTKICVNAHSSIGYDHNGALSWQSRYKADGFWPGSGLAKSKNEEFKVWMPVTAMGTICHNWRYTRPRQPRHPPLPQGWEGVETRKADLRGGQVLNLRRSEGVTWGF